MKMKAILLVFVALLSLAYSKDPAGDWLGYAKATSTGQRITYIEAFWVVPENPKENGGFFSPWFGIETSDNLNLLQPVNPWMSNSWVIYNEYFQWKPTYNYNSKSHGVKAGDVLYGNITYIESSNSYRLYHNCLNETWGVETDIPIQKENGQFKNYTIAYFVFEKVWKCRQYPPNNQVTFYDIKIQYDGQTVQPTWTTGYESDACNCRAHILDETTVQITWDSSL